MSDEATPDSVASSRAFIGRESFRAQLRAALLAAATEGWPELLLSDADFRDWPLDDRLVIDALHRWVRNARRCTLLATSYEQIPRQHARFVEWRRLWSHKIECRLCRDADPQHFPSALWSPSWAMQRLDPVVHTGWMGVTRCDGGSCASRLTAGSAAAPQDFQPIPWDCDVCLPRVAPMHQGLPQLCGAKL